MLINCSKEGCKIKVEKTDRRILKTKKSIKSALLTLMNWSYVDDLAITELCKIAHINRKTFYTYYDSIHDVVFEYEDTIASNLTEEIYHLRNDEADPCLIIISFQNMIYDNKDFLRCLYEQDLLFTLEKKLKRQLSRMALERYSSRKNVSQQRLFEASLTIEYVVSGAVSMQLKWFFSEYSIHFPLFVEISCKFIKQNITVLDEN